MNWLIFIPILVAVIALVAIPPVMYWYLNSHERDPLPNGREDQHKLPWREEEERIKRGEP
jgi:hypothetical protein